MKIKHIIIAISLTLLSVPAFAGGGHDHGHGHSHGPVEQPKAEAIAASKVASLVRAGKLEQSWKTVKVAKAEQKKFGNNMEWVISFNNPKVSDSKKQTLYVFLTLDGNYLAANFSGK